MSNEKSLILYIVMFLIASFVLSLCKKNEKNKVINKILFLAAIVLPIFILGFRYYVGADYENYLIMYEKYKNISIVDAFGSKIEILNILLCKLIYIIYDNKYIFILIYAILTVTISFKAILNIESKNTFLITFMYLCLFFAFAANGVRQSLAIAIILYAYTILFKDIKKFFLLCLIAFFVHSSAIVILPIGIIYYITKNTKICNFIILITYAMMILLICIGLPFTSSNMFIQKLLGYLEINGDVEFGIGVLLLNLPVLLLSIFFYNKNREENYSLYIIIFIVNIMFSYLGYINISLNRFAYYFSIIQIFLIPKGIDIFKDNGIRIILEIIFSIVILYQFVNTTYIKDQGKIYPYNYIEVSDLEKNTSI